MRLIDADELRKRMYHDAFETDSDMQKWDGGCWIRYKMFENAIEDAPTIKAEPARRGRWIPVTERLPQEETDVLVTRTFLGVIDGNHGWVSHIPPKTYVEVAQYFNGEWTALSDEYKVARSRHTEPVAWMPLPEPYCGAKMEGER